MSRAHSDGGGRQADLESLVQEALARLAGQGIRLSVEALRSEIARRATRGHDGLRLYELGLVTACLAHDEAAIRTFESQYVAQGRRALSRMGLAESFVEDVLGWLRAELFARPTGPLLCTYSGRGDLGSWVRAIAVHEGMKRARRARRELGDEALTEAASSVPLPDAELVAMRGAYGAELTRALAESFRSLSTQERNLLRQYFLDGLTIDMLARLYGIHRATAARRVAAARELLVSRVRQALIADLGLSEAGVDGVITLSNLNESLGQLLRTTKE